LPTDDRDKICGHGGVALSTVIAEEKKREKKKWKGRGDEG